MKFTGRSKNNSILMNGTLKNMRSGELEPIFSNIYYF